MAKKGEWIMSQTTELHVNRLPSITWNWLRVNDRKVAFSTDGADAAPVAEVPGTVQVSDDFSALAAIATGAGVQVDELMKDTTTAVYVVSGQNADPMKLTFDMADGQSGLNRYGVVLEEDAEATLIMDFKSAKEATGYLGVQTKVLGKKNSLLHVVQVHRLGDEFTCINDLGADLEEGAKIELIHVVFSGKENDLGVQFRLTGDQSAAEVNVAYLGEKDHRIDMNYNFQQYGKNTRSDFTASGVLRDHAWKTMRDTIDFKRGSCGSTGDENESVLLMDDEIVNQSIPVILCSEEDVEGNHGASIGRLDEALLFYLETRGISYDEIYEMMAQARLDAVISLIPEEDFKNELLAYNDGGEKE